MPELRKSRLVVGIKIGCRVRQGDPFTSSLQMLIDHALENAGRVGAGFMLGETRVQTLAFVDGAVLFASNSGGLN